MRINHLILSLLLIAVVLGCSSAGGFRGGQADTNIFQVAEDRIVIRFSGNPGMTPKVIRELLLYRAAEFAVAHGYPYFDFRDARATEGQYGSTALYGRGESVGIPHEAVNRGDRLDPCGVEAERGGGFTSMYSTTAVVRLLKEPGGVTRALDAQKVLSDLAGRVRETETRSQ